MKAKGRKMVGKDECVKEQKRRGVKKFKRSGEEIGNRVRKTRERREKERQDEGRRRKHTGESRLENKKSGEVKHNFKKKDELKEVIEKEVKGEKSTEIHTDL